MVNNMMLSAAVLLSLSSTAVLAQFTNQSAPFYLLLESDDATYDNVSLTPCHEGAAIESLCVLSDATTEYTYTLNTSIYSENYNQTFGNPGYLIWTLTDSNVNEPEPMSLYYDISTNVALPLFVPTFEGTLVAFDDCNKLNIQSELNDTVDPPTDGTLAAYYRWYTCRSNYEGYVYQTLNWVLGNAAPENPTCVKVDVVRKFV